MNEESYSLITEKRVSGMRIGVNVESTASAMFLKSACDIEILNEVFEMGIDCPAFTHVILFICFSETI